MILVKSLKFFYCLFLCKKFLEMLFGDARGCHRSGEMVTEKISLRSGKSRGMSR